MTKLILLAALVLIATFAASERRDAHAAYAGKNGLIVYNHEGDLWTINPNGTGAVNITNNDEFDHDPSWANGGQMLAFQSERDDPNDDIYISEPDGSEAQNITDNPAADYDPVWAPDNQMIAWSSERDGNSEIYTVSEASGPANITNNASFDGDASWGVNNLIAFDSDRSGNMDIWTMMPTGGSPTKLTTSAAFDAAPAWSPDASKIAFVSDRDGNDEIYVMDANGGNVVRMTNNNADDEDPAWSPDGTMIAFTSDRSGNPDIWTMNATNGSDLFQVTTDPDADWVPDWQPIPLAGDTNCDLHITPLDPLLALQGISGMTPQAPCYAAANVRCQDALDPGDITPVLRHIASLSEDLPNGCPAVGT